MSLHRPLLAIAIVAGAAGSASAQTPTQTPPASPPAAPAQARAPLTRLSDPYMDTYSSGHTYRSRTAPRLPPRDPDSDYGFRNPGGVGRMAEFYPPGNSFQSGGGAGTVGSDPVKVAQFGNGPSATSRAEQLQAQAAGNAKTRTLNQHIDTYSQPLRFGYGFGFGGYGGFPY